MWLLQAVRARTASNEVIARCIVSGGAYGTHRAIANRSASARMSVRFPADWDVFGWEWGAYGCSALARWPQMGSSVLRPWSAAATSVGRFESWPSSPSANETRTVCATSRDGCFWRSGAPARRWLRWREPHRPSPSRCGMIRCADGLPPLQNAEIAPKLDRCFYEPAPLASRSVAGIVQSRRPAP